MSAAVQTRLPVAGYSLPVEAARLTGLSCFELRHQLRELDLDDEQVAAAEQAVEMARRGHYPSAPTREAA